WEAREGVQLLNGGPRPPVPGRHQMHFIWRLRFLILSPVPLAAKPRSAAFPCTDRGCPVPSDVAPDCACTPDSVPLTPPPRRYVPPSCRRSILRRIGRGPCRRHRRGQ